MFSLRFKKFNQYAFCYRGLVGQVLIVSVNKNYALQHAFMLMFRQKAITLFFATTLHYESLCHVWEGASLKNSTLSKMFHETKENGIPCVSSLVFTGLTQV